MTAQLLDATMKSFYEFYKELIMKLMTKLITVAVFAGCLAACQGEKGESNTQTTQSQNAE